MVSIAELFLPPEINSEYYMMILSLIRDGVTNVEEISSKLSLSKENTYRALSVLKKLGLIEKKKGLLSLSPIGFITISPLGESFLKGAFIRAYKGAQIILEMLRAPTEEQTLISEVIKKLEIERYEQKVRVKYAIKRTIEFLEILGIIRREGNFLIKTEETRTNVSVVDITDFVRKILASINKKPKRISLVIETEENESAKIIAAIIAGALSYFVSKIEEE